jgi:hypothetical protein
MLEAVAGRVLARGAGRVLGSWLGRSTEPLPAPGRPGSVITTGG